MPRRSMAPSFQFDFAFEHYSGGIGMRQPVPLRGPALPLGAGGANTGMRWRMTYGC